MNEEPVNDGGERAGLRGAGETGGFPVDAAVAGIEQASVLDRVADPVTAMVRSALPAGPLKDALSGTWLGHTLHPVLNDVTIGPLVQLAAARCLRRS